MRRCQHCADEDADFRDKLYATNPMPAAMAVSCTSRQVLLKRSQGASTSAANDSGQPSNPRDDGLFGVHLPPPQAIIRNGLRERRNELLGPGSQHTLGIIYHNAL
jgi:hypothetical protein